MLIDTNRVIYASEANQNFLKANGIKTEKDEYLIETGFSFAKAK